MASMTIPNRGVCLSTRMICNTRPITACMQRQQRSRSACMRLQAYRREYPDPEFITEVREAFPDAAIADVEQARVIQTPPHTPTHHHHHYPLQTMLSATCILLSELRSPQLHKHACVNLPLYYRRWRAVTYSTTRLLTAVNLRCHIARQVCLTDSASCLTNMDMW